MAATQNGFTELSSDTDAPKWLSHAVKLALVVVPVLLSTLQPGGAFSSQAAQAVIVAVGLILAGLIHLVETSAKDFKHYGFSKLAFQKAVSDDEAWVKENASDIKTTVQAGLEAVKTINGVPDALAALQEKVAPLEAKIEAAVAQVQATPTVDMAPIQAFVKDEITKGVAEAFGKAAASSAS